MALATLYRLSASVGNAFPDNLVTVDLATDDFAARIVIESTHKIHVVADTGKCGALTRSWLPLTLEWDANLEAEALTLLHPLDVVLETTHQFVDKLILGNVIMRVRSELLSFFFIT